jgi:predicted RNA-binding protein with RPS1 domain
MPSSSIPLRIGAITIAIVLAAAALAPWIAPYDPAEQLDPGAGALLPPLSSRQAVALESGAWLLVESSRRVDGSLEVVRKGDRLRCVVLSVDTTKKRIALGLKQLANDPWVDTIPNNYHVGDLLSGYVTKITNFGVFVKLEEDLEGLLHISELSDHKIESPEEIVKPGMKIEVRVIRVDTEDRKIGLSFVHADFEENDTLVAEFQKKAAEEAAKAPAEEGKATNEPVGEAPAPEAEPVAEVVAPPAETAPAPGRAASSHLYIAMSFASGFAALGYQMAWARYFSLLSTGSVYFTAVFLAVFLLALAAGSGDRGSGRAGRRDRLILKIRWRFHGRK